MPTKDEAKEETWKIWVKVGDGGSSAIHIVNTADVGAFKDLIKAKFADELAGIGVTKLVVRAPHETLAADADPKSVKPAEFKQVLDNPKLTLAEVLKPTTAGEYEVYVELPATPGMIKKTVWLPSMANFTPQELPLYKEADPLTFIEPAGWVRKIKTLVTEEYKLEESRGSKRRVRPLCVARCSRGGKTRALQELQRELKQDGIPVIFVTFNDYSTMTRDGSEQRDPLSALLIRIAFLATHGSNQQLFSSFRDKYIVSQESIVSWLGKKCVLIIDELNKARILQEKGNETANDFFEFLRATFLHPANRALVFSTHLLGTTIACNYYLGGSTSGREVRLEQLPLIVDLDKANELVAGMTIQELLYYNKIPALIYTRTWTSMIFDDLEDELKKSPLDRMSVVSLLQSFSTGSIVDSRFQPFFDSTSTPSGETRVIWIMCHMHRLLGILTNHFFNSNRELSDQLSSLHKLVGEFHASKSGSGDGFEKLFAFTFLLRCFCGLDCAPFFDGNRPRSFSYNKYCGSRFDQCLNYSELKDTVTVPPKKTFPHMAYYAPTQHSFHKYDAFAWLYRTKTEKPTLLGFQLKEGRATPSSDADEAEVPASFLVRGNAAGTSKEIRGWRFVSKAEAELFFGLSGSMWIPSELQKLRDALGPPSPKKRARAGKSISAEKPKRKKAPIRNSV